MTEYQKIKEKIEDFEMSVLFNPEYDHLKIQSVHIDHNYGENQAVIITSDDKSLEAVKELISPYFTGVRFTVQHEGGHAEFTAKLFDTKGIKNANSTSWGTVAGFFKKKGKVYGLSNAHVLTNYMQGKKGDPITYEPNVAAGTLFKFFKILSGSNVNQVDAAIFEVKENTKVGWLPKSKPSSLNPIGAKLNMVVTKTGFASGHTTGIVKGVNAAVKVKLNEEEYFFRKVIKILGTDENKDFNEEGDSGSLILSFPNKKMVGLVFAKKGKVCYALPIANAMKLFDFV